MPLSSGSAPTKLAVQNAHPRDRRVTFQEDGHLYFIDGSNRFVSSVTTVVHGRFERFDPDAILQKHYARWQRFPQKKPEYAGKTREEIKAMWREKGEVASALGTALHESIELFYNGDKPAIDASLKEWLLFQKFQSAFQLQPFRTEAFLWSKEHRLAGSVDFLATNEDGSITVVDWKRSCHDLSADSPHWGRYGKAPFENVPDTHFHKYSLQLCCYKFLLEAFYGRKVRQCLLVQLHPEFDDYRVVECHDYGELVARLMQRRARAVRLAERFRTAALAALAVAALRSGARRKRKREFN